MNINFNVVKVVGVVSAALGVAATVASNWATEKKTDETIAKKVAEALASKADQ